MLELNETTPRESDPAACHEKMCGLLSWLNAANCPEPNLFREKKKKPAGCHGPAGLAVDGEKGISIHLIGWIFSEWAKRPMQEDLSVAT